MYILNNRAEKIMSELSKNNYYESNCNIMMVILKKVISNEKLVIPRLPIFEKIAPSINAEKWWIIYVTISSNYSVNYFNWIIKWLF